MKRLILVKTSPEVQLAHLYEHIYLMAVVECLKSHQLFDYLDYWFYGKTYYGGVMHLEVHLYTAEAEKLLPKLKRLDPSFDKDIIAGAVAQIIAEKGVRIGGNPNLFGKALQELQAQPWQTMDALTSYTRFMRGSRKVFWDTDIKARTKEMHCALILDNTFVQQRRELLPLFDVVAHILQDNMANLLTDNYYYHLEGSTSTYTKQLAKRVCTFRAWLPAIARLTDELEVCRAFIVEAFHHNIMARTADFLQRVTYESYETMFITPDELKLYEATGILLGGAGWRKIATEPNIKILLQHTTLQLTFGRQRQSFRLDELL